MKESRPVNLRFLLIIGISVLINVGFSNKCMAQDEVEVITPHPDFTVNYKGAVLAGKNLIVTFTVKSEKEFEMYDFLGHFGGSNQTLAYDDEGTSCHVEIRFGGKSTRSGGMVRGTMPKGIPVKVVATISEFGSDATSIPLLKIKGECSTYGYYKEYTGFFEFKNIPFSDKK